MSLASDRWDCSTVRVRTGFGTLYVHVDHAREQIKHVRISFPPRHEGSAIGNALEALGYAITKTIGTITKRGN